MLLRKLQLLDVFFRLLLLEIVVKKGLSVRFVLQIVVKKGLTVRFVLQIVVFLYVYFFVCFLEMI